ncbi:microcystin-dependent protein [Cylindrospermum stagnale PCC 7417]|uniref:Microcystin-dependent protein n=1 Tax=Cylindrospermum stagnale PCC 7417 TaxID=56107 RepID=K9X259_9NOST|nr:microcystin-dependent protein [Cylindrospermum stagnale]AFZ26121.1 microcystin-dependent protein [Cylindrospermum stagnale PCC 7417]
MSTNKKMPFRFEFFYEPATEENLKDILLIDAPSEVPPLHLNIINNLVDQPITIPASETDGLVTLDNYHFKLKFNPQVLVTAENIQLQNSNWVLAHAKEAGSSSDGLYLCLKGEDIILESDKPIELTFNGVGATDFQTETRTSGTSVEMSWVLQIEQLAQSLDGEEHDGERETLTLTPRAPGDSDGYETTSTKTLEKVKQKGKPNIPLAVGFAGSNRVLNTNSEESNLQLRITNTAEPGSPNIIFYYDSDTTKCSQLGIALEVGDTTAFPWVLGTKDDVNNITMSIAGNKWKQLSDKPTEVIVGGVSALEWTFIPNSANVELAAQETILVDIQKIKTAHPTGATKLNLRYQYVPEYQDGEFVCAIEKTPLVFHDYKVGIGTTQPKESLHIKAGNLRIENTDASTNGEIQTNGTLVLRSNVDKTEDLSVKFFNQTNQTVPLMVLHKDGKLGIGTASPEAKLHVTETIKAKNVEVIETVTAKKIVADGAVFTGMILMWSGAADKIPAGWALCNGTNTTPDLRDRFLVGAGKDYPVGNTGGLKEVILTEEQMPSHNHGVDDPGHTHSIEMRDSSSDLQPTSLPLYARNDINDGNRKGTNSATTGISILSKGGGKAHENRPPYYALCFIMKVDIP